MFKSSLDTKLDNGLIRIRHKTIKRALKSGKSQEFIKKSLEQFAGAIKTMSFTKKKNRILFIGANWNIKRTLDK